MRKLLFGVWLLLLLSCSSSSDNEEVEEPILNYPCRYDYILRSVDNPILSITSGGERTIDFTVNYSDYNGYSSGEPDVEKTCNYFKELTSSEFRKYQSHFTNLGNLNPPSSYNIYIGKMNNNDYFQFDKNETKETGKINVTFYCIH